MKEYYFQDLALGMQESFQTVISEEQMDSFCKLSGDENPLHLDRDYARINGFRDRVAYGLLVASFYSRLVGMYLPGKYCLLHGVDIDFLKPVFIQDKLIVSGKISYINVAYKQIEIKANITKVDEGGGECIKVSKALIKAGVLL